MAIVSVVIPSFNCAEYLPKAIESILRQTLADWELIVVDDGSTDNTRTVLERYLKEPRIRYLYQENSGLPGARNTGARVATAPYLAFLDADDALAPEALEKMHAAVERSDADWCVIDLLKVRGNASTEVHRTELPAGDLLYGILADDFIRRAMFFCREAFIAVGMYDEEMKNREDWDINIRMIEAGRPFVYVSEALYLYSWREGSITTGNSSKMLHYTEKVLSKHHKRLADAGDRAARKLYAHNMWALARNHFYAARSLRKAVAGAWESFAYEPSLRRLIHPVVHQFRGSTTPFSRERRLVNE